MRFEDKKKIIHTGKQFYYAVREAYPMAMPIYPLADYTPAKESAKLRKVSSDSDLSQEEKESTANLFEASLFSAVGQAAYTLQRIFDLASQVGWIVAETKNIDHSPVPAKEKPNLRKVSSDSDLSQLPTSAGQETKNFDPVLSEASPSSGQEKKFDPVLFEVSPFDGGREMKDFDPKLLESSSADGEEKEECPNFLQLLSCNAKGTQNSFFRELELSVAKELTDSWFVPVHEIKRSRLDGEATMWEDVDDSSVDKEVKLDPKLFQVKDATGYHSLTPIEKRNWITLQFIMECYDPPYRSLKPEPSAVFEDSGQEGSGQEDYLSDLSGMFHEV